MLNNRNFDCSKCRNRGEEKGTCKIFSVIPMFHSCAGYSPTSSEPTLTNMAKMEKAIRMRAAVLFDEHSDSLDISPEDWISIISGTIKMETSRLEKLGYGSSPTRLRRFINGWSPDIEE